MLLVATMAVLCSTCDATTAVSPPFAEPIVLGFTGDTVVVVGRTVVPVVTAELRGEPVANARFSFLSADTSVIAVTPRQDSIAGRKRGCSSLTIRLENAILGDGAPVLVQRMCAVAGAVSLDRSSLSFESIGETATLSATALDGDGAVLSGAPVQWQSLDTLVADVSAGGRVTARGQGSTEIRATVDTASASLPVSVAQRLTDFTFEPAAIVLDAFGAETTVVATARDARGFAMIETVAIWESRDTNVVAVSPAGLITSRGNGVTHVLARRDAVVDSLRVEVRQRATSVVISSVSGFRITSLGDELLLSGRGIDRLGHVILDATPTWISLTPTIAEVLPDRGLVTGLSVGDAPVVATLDGVADTVAVEVRNLPVSLELVPGEATLTSLGDQITFGVIALNGRGASISGLQLAWQTTDAEVLSLTSGGLATAVTEGRASVIASADGLADTAVVTVENRPASIVIVPSDFTFTFVGDTLSPAVEIRNARGDLLERTAVTWESEDPTIASVTSTTGLVTARAVGQTYVRAVHQSLRDSILITVRNDPASLVIDATLDTLTALGQQLTYTATVRNANGDLLSDPPIWQSTNTSVASVTAGGVVSGVGYGTARVIASAGTVSDTVTVVLVNPTTVYVDNSVVVSPRFGTRARPYASIQAGVNVADAYDTVLVRPGASPYSETVALGRRITLLGDSTAFLADGRNPARLPVITHDTGTAGILAHTRAPVIVRYFSILHSVDGAAVDVDESDAQLEYIYVNPGTPGLRIGRGILLRNVASSATVANSVIANVAGYGIRMSNVRGGRIGGVQVVWVDALAGESGAGIHITSGDANVVELSRIRGTAGPHIFGDSTAGLRISDNDLAGRHQIIRLVRTSGATEISRNTVNLTRQAEDPGVAGSETDGRSGVEIRGPSTVTIVDNVFTEPGTSLMDAIRLIDARASGAVAVRVHDNRFHRGRHAVRSERSTWEMLRSRSDSAILPVVTTEADTLTLVDDTLAAVIGTRCLAVNGTASMVTLTRGRLEQCSPTTSAIGEPAISVLTGDARVDVAGTRFVGQHQTAIQFTGRRLTVRGAIVERSLPATATSYAAAAVIDASADSLRISGTTISRHAMLTAINASGGDLQVDSSRLTVNARGIRVGTWTAIRLLDNDIFDNTIAGLENATSSGIAAPGNWWGDALGPRRSSEPAAVGDSIIGSASHDPVRSTPLAAGAVTAELRKVRGDGQTAPRGSVLPQAFSVRVVDASGRPVAGVAVTFAVQGGGSTFVSPSSGSTVVVTTDAGGLAQATLQLGNGSSPTPVLVSAPGAASVTFTATPSP